jgi:hypothetical protein
MTDVKPSSKPQDCYLKNVSTANVEPSNSSWLKGAGDKRADAFPESEKADRCAKITPSR